MDDNVAVVRAAYAAFGRGDISAILELLHDDIAWSAPRSLPQGGTFAG
jgi:ketosteroid isomerase-like protein